MQQGIEHSVYHVQNIRQNTYSITDLLMAKLLALFEEFVNEATGSDVKVPERVDETGTALWEHVGEPEHRKALLSELKLSAINLKLQAVIRSFIHMDVHPHPDPFLRGRWAQIAMGVLANFAADGNSAANLVARTMKSVMDDVQACAGFLTMHGPFTTEYANCIHSLLKLKHKTSPEGAAKDSIDDIAASLCANMEEWLQLIMSGNSDLTVEVLKLLHAAAEADPQVQEAALEAAVLPALCDFLTEATQGRIGLHVDSSATAAACDLLDLFLMSAVLQDSTTAEESRSGESHLRVALNRELAASLARQLVAVLEKSESTAVSAACTICLYRLACMEDDPVPDVAEHCCQHSCKTEHSAREVFRSMASAETVGDHERSSGHRSTLQSEVSQHQAAYDTNLQPHHSLWHLAHSGGAVEAIVVAAATLACDGPAGSYWANVVAVIAVLSWVGAALVKAWKVRVSPQPGHTGTDPSCKGVEPAKKRAKLSNPATARYQEPAVHQDMIDETTIAKSTEFERVQDVSHRFIAKVQRLQEDLLVGLSQEETRDGVQYVQQCSKALRQLMTESCKATDPTHPSSNI